MLQAQLRSLISFLRSYPYLSLLWSLLAIGISLRLMHFMGGRSLWIDEAMLAINIVERSYQDLLKPLDYHQMAPAGWLLIQRFLHEIWSQVEYSQRFVSLIASIGSVAIFAGMAHRHLDRTGAICAVGLFALSAIQIRYAAEIKPYAVDVFFSTALMWFGLHLISEKSRPTVGFWILLLITGLSGVMLSMASVFVLAAVGGLAFLSRVLERDYATAGGLVAVNILCAVLFLFLYITTYAQPSDVVDAMVNNHWVPRFAPLPTSPADVNWYFKSLHDLFVYFFGLPSISVVGVVLIASLYFIWKRQLYWTAAIVLGPVVITLLASAAHMYPFYARFLLFAMPQFIFLIGLTVSALADATPRPYFISALLFLMLVGGSLRDLEKEFIEFNPPFDHENTQSVFQTLSARYQSEDVVYLYYGSLPAARFYQSEYGLDKMKVVEGRTPRDNWTCMLGDMMEIGAVGRVWMVVSHRFEDEGVDELKLLRYFAGSRGVEKEFMQFGDAYLLLYDFGQHVSQVESLDPLPIGNLDALCGREFWMEDY